MATAKTPKTAPAKAAVKPAAVKLAAPKPAAAKPAAVAKPPEEAVIHSTEIAAEAVVTVPQAVEAAAEKVSPEVAEAVKPAKAVIAKAVKPAEDKMLQGVETFLEFGRDNAILLVSAGNDFALGLHKLSLSLIDWSAESCDKSVVGASALLSAKTVEEVLGLSQSLAKDGFEQLLKEGTELGSLSTKLLEDTFAPLPGRMVAAVEKLAAHSA